MHKRLSVNILCILVCLLAVGRLSAQPESPSDSTRRTKALSTVAVKGQTAPVPELTQAPTQVVDAKRMEQTGVTVLSDAVKQMAGVVVKDYGGIGGMKTVSSRGLGSQFSTLTIDGVPVNDAQNGQVDLGRYLTGNSDHVSLGNGLGNNLLQTARAAAAGSILNMETSRPQVGERGYRLSAGLEGGSFGLLSPTLKWDQRLGERLAMTFYGNFTHSNGDYPFRLYYTTTHTDSSSIEYREHSAMWLATGDLNLYYEPAPGQTLTAKTHYVRGYHELPGPVTYYAKRGTEDTEEQLFFTQIRYRVDRGGKWSFQAVGKYQNSYDMYENYAAQTVSRYLCNEYRQNEGYVSGTAVWHPATRWRAALATDATLTTLHSNLANNNEVRRLTSLTSLTTQYNGRLIDLKANLLATIVEEKANSADSLVSYRELSPYAGLNSKPILGKVRLRYFYKTTYRVPNFNEMYYFSLPRDLRPERAIQHNVGLTIPLTPFTTHRDTSSYDEPTGSFALTVDGYHNRVHDKIIAIPTQNMFLWSMMNLGVVGITGLDISGNAQAEIGHANVHISITYTYQKAIDLTDPESKTYGHQIPYTPRHSGGLTLYAEHPWVNVGYNVMLVGDRYSKAQNLDETRLPAYADHGITADRSFSVGGGTLFVQAQVLNLLNVQYEVVRSYPMMGRNWRLRLTYIF